MRFLLAILVILLIACSLEPGSASTTTSKLVIMGWVGYMPQQLLNTFQAETGIAVEYIGYDTPEQALAALDQGKPCDLMIINSPFIPTLIATGKIVPLNYENIPNARNIRIDFRDLVYDPGGRYSIVYQWGITGLLVRTDLVDKPITSWADLWDPTLAGKIVLWPIPRDTVSVLLKSLGYSINTTDPHQLALARERAPELARRVTMVEEGYEVVTPYLISGDYVVALGWPHDALDAQAQTDQITFVVPAEGTILLVDTFVVPTRSTQKVLAERFINFVLQPAISALVTNETKTATANELSLPLIDPVLRNNTAVFPSPTILRNAELEMPLDPQTQVIYYEIYNIFIDAKP